LPEIAFGVVKEAPPFVERAKKIGDCVYLPLWALKRNRVHVT